MKLHDYINANGMTFTSAATALGCSSQYVSRICRGERNASPALTLRIERWTNGLVPRHETRPDVYPGEKVG